MLIPQVPRQEMNLRVRLRMCVLEKEQSKRQRNAKKNIVRDDEMMCVSWRVSAQD